MTIQNLLARWSTLIEMGEQDSKTKANKAPGGLEGRIKRTTGFPVIFDADTHKEQREIQNLLCKELPELSDIIRSQPEIMDGFKWIRNDFIELYFSHFRLVVSKIEKITSKKNAV